ncbi:hypothetical protein TSAR_011872 [Trichomalopsis sarcophagae]|uniref:Uncharacterized protein n=1 Tax=Trichomalopsis sarcophagae TaxID=543379 RepID=A0A232EU05_9HYME|nr:hypothetical protein TSAR_011872 [Trichomalopsis sarcophagae]
MDDVTLYRQKLGWLPVKARREYFLGALTFVLLQTSRPNYLAKNFILTADRDVRRSTRHRVPTFYIHRFNTNLFLQLFSNLSLLFLEQFTQQHYLTIPQ